MTGPQSDLLAALTELHVAAWGVVPEGQDAENPERLRRARDMARAAIAKARAADSEILAALRAARGWVVTCSESATARSDLKLIDAAIAKAERGGA